jgi:hypothetical protein
MMDTLCGLRLGEVDIRMLRILPDLSEYLPCCELFEAMLTSELYGTYHALPYVGRSKDAPELF